MYNLIIMMIGSTKLLISNMIRNSILNNMTYISSYILITIVRNQKDLRIYYVGIFKSFRVLKKFSSNEVPLLDTTKAVFMDMKGNNKQKTL
jgi:hypothetical protein